MLKDVAIPIFWGRKQMVLWDEETSFSKCIKDGKIPINFLPIYDRYADLKDHVGKNI